MKIRQKTTLPDGNKVCIKKLNLILDRWDGTPIKDSYGNKQLVNYKGKPLFAELAVLKMMCKQGWDGVWVDTYRKRFLTDLPEKNKEVKLPLKISKLLEKIIEKNGKFSGCWDIFLWKGNRIKFFELKRRSKDAMRINQIRWLAAAIYHGYSSGQFAIIKWDIAKKGLKI